MRTTLDIDEDILMAAKALARHQNLSAGQIVSQLLRKALTGEFRSSQFSEDFISERQAITGFRPFPSGKAIVTNDVVNSLREAESV
jgi:Family of unknown function (DUF6364)